MRRKWRPPLTLVIGGTLAAVLCLPLIGIGYLKLAGNILGWGETSWLIAWMAMISTAILAFLLWRLVLRPVRALTAHARALRDGREDVAPPEHFGTPELGALGESVIEMGRTLQDREAGIRAYADHVTHELKSPLTTIRGAAELLQGDLPKAERARLLASVEVQAKRMTGLLEDLQRLARARDPRPGGRARLSAVVANLTLPVPVEITTDGEVAMAEDGLSAVITQLARNAADHGASRLELRAEGRGLVVADDGPGISEGNRAKVFEPFFTTRREDGGTGLGLAIVKTLVDAAGGEIALLEDRPGAGFRIGFD